MKQPMTDLAGIERKRAAPAARESVAGVLGAMMLVLPACAETRSLQGLEAAGVADPSARFETARAGLRDCCEQAACVGNDCRAIERAVSQPISQWGNWSDWRNF